jgi:hypothetical protein
MAGCFGVAVAFSGSCGVGGTHASSDERLASIGGSAFLAEREAGESVKQRGAKPPTGMPGALQTCYSSRLVFLFHFLFFHHDVADHICHIANRTFGPYSAAMHRFSIPVMLVLSAAPVIAKVACVSVVGTLVAGARNELREHQADSPRSP